MIDDWKTPRDSHELNIMWKCAKMSRYYCIGFIIINKSALGTQAISNLWEPVKFLLSGSNKTGLWPLYFQGSFPYDYRTHPNYELTLLGQCFSITCASLSYDSTDSFFCILMLHLIGQLSILKMKIINLNKHPKTNETDKTFLTEYAYVHMMHNRLRR